MFQTGRNSSLLELEAADYFKLDPAQVNMLCNSSSSQNTSTGMELNPMTDLSKSSRPNRTAPLFATRAKSEVKHRSRATKLNIQSEGLAVTSDAPKLSPSKCANNKKRTTSNITDQPQRRAAHLDGPSSKFEPRPPSRTQQQLAQPAIGDSSTASTNSLPSISSSPSVSPSLVCPHLSLDDILNRRYVSTSPHTIGLCDRCQLDPPPNMHSPLSPAFKPSRKPSFFDPKVPSNPYSPVGQLQHLSMNPIRRGNSDYHEIANSHRRHTFANSPLNLTTTTRTTRDDSLDYYLDPDELKRAQMSPVQRNSVEFIRKYSTEVGRVLKVYKNGQPYEKALRICMTRGEFANLNNLLDHINSRQLIPGGARYLFHLDGQLVYSVNELKHGSSYIVSGVRHFDTKASAVIKEQQTRELNQAHHFQERLLQRRLLDGRASKSLGDLSKLDDSAEAAVKSYQIMKELNRANRVGQKSAATFNSRDQIYSAGLKTAAQSSPKSVNKVGKSQTNRSQIGPTAGRQRQPIESSPNRGSSRPNNQPSGKDFMNKRPAGTSQGEQASQKYQKKSQSSESLLQNATETQFESKQSMAGGGGGGGGGGNLSRAKSELSSSALKRKKNVTFMDTGQMSSPIMRRTKESQEELAVEQEFATDSSSRSGQADHGLQMNASSETNEIGIQVTDSLDGFLIDLPLPMPKRGVEKQEQLERQLNARKRVGLGAQRSGLGQGQGRQATARGIKRIVTISERDLSIDELDQFKDLDHGDHHGDKQTGMETSQSETSKCDASTTVDGLAKQARSSVVHHEKEVVLPDRSNTINIGQDIDASRLISRTKVDEAEAAGDGGVQRERPHWQYPGGLKSSATPIERPVSQSEANEIVHARVTTPTPSISTTAGDNTSLQSAMDSVKANSPLISSDQQQQMNNKRIRQQKMKLLQAKKQVPVMGKLYLGANTPAKNFRLTWVNGFTINDHYPENCVSVASALNAASQQSQSSEVAARVPSPRATVGEHLSPGHVSQRQQQPASIQFKPNERFCNWICHSSLHDELIYPAGSLVVLWCRWTNEQRYYSKHSTNISAITLAPSNPDLVASSELGGQQNESSSGQAIIHLWSSTSLTTVMLLEEPAHLRGVRVFSLKLRRTAERDGWSLLAGGKDDKQSLVLLSFELALASTTTSEEAKSSETKTIGEETTTTTNNNSHGNHSKQAVKNAVIKATKQLQPNQVPLLVTHVPIESSGQVEAKSSAKQSMKSKAQARDLLLSFGRRHFQLWSQDWTRQRLQLMQMAEGKSTLFVEMMTGANCLARLAPNEFLLGDTSGNIVLIVLNLQQQQISSKKLKIGTTNQTSDNNYGLEIVRLIEPKALSQPASRSPSPAASVAGGTGAELPTASVTSLARISGNIFASADTNCIIRFWKIDRSSAPTGIEMVPNSATSSSDPGRRSLSCRQLTCVGLPCDLGFICSIVLSGFDRKQSIVEFYAIATSNAILFGSIQLQLEQPNKQSTASNNIPIRAPFVSVVYEGHETSVMNLVAEPPRAPSASAKPLSLANKLVAASNAAESSNYFTCSLDFKICKWNGRSLVWKSMLPSACVSLAVHPTGFVLAIGSADGTVYVLDKISGLLISYFPLTPVCINCLAYSADGSLLAAGCSNGSIFILPVHENGLKYKKVSIFQSPFPVVSLQFSFDNRYLLTSVTHSHYQELILWDLPNFRYMRDNVKTVADKIDWFEPVCSGSEDVRAIWENVNLPSTMRTTKSRLVRKRSSAISLSNTFDQDSDSVVNLSCHRLVVGQSITDQSYCIASDTRGHLRLFNYPCRNIEQGFYEAKVTSSPVNCCRFLAPTKKDSHSFVSSSLDGSIFLWTLE